jgi:hypothetical protein
MTRAKVGHYLAVLTASNVRGMLKRKARQPEVAQVQHAVLPPGEQATQALRRQLQSWEDDGGSVRLSTVTHRRRRQPASVSP